jgi:hypothetical protein
MNLIKLKDKEKTMELLKVSLNEIYDEFKSLVHIKKLFKLKKEYLLEFAKKKNTFKFIDGKTEDNKKEEIEIIEPIEVENNYENILKKEKSIEEIHKLKKTLLNRLLFLSKSIKKSVNDVISSSKLSDMYSGLLETSCCMEEATSYIGYYYFIENLDNNPVKKYIDESRLLFDLTKYYIEKGSIHRFLFYDKYKFDGIHNYPIVDNQKDTSQTHSK